MELKELAQERKWYDFTEKIKSELSRGANAKEAEQMAETFGQYISKIHPLSIVSTVVSLFPHLHPTKAVDLIEKSISIISSSETNYSQELVCLKLYRCIGYVKMNNFEDIESQLIFLKNSAISNENLNFLLLVASSYYEAIGNIENAQEYLFRHAKETGFLENPERLVILSILSKTFFDFAAVSSFNEFKLIKDENLKKLFILFQEGDMAGIEPKTACALLGVESIDFLKEKIYLVNILKICFQSEQKFVFFEQLIECLKMDEQTVICLLIRALGLNIINGWIDSEQRIFYFNSVLPRALSASELQKLKFKFIEWRAKVDRVLTAME